MKWQRGNTVIRSVREFRKLFRDRWRAETALRVNQASLKRLEVCRAAGYLLPRDGVVASWKKIVELTAWRLLSIPEKIDGELLRCKSREDVREVLTREIKEAMQELSAHGQAGLDP